MEYRLSPAWPQAARRMQLSSLLTFRALRLVPGFSSSLKSQQIC
jgi:hypothetical protein